MNPPASHPSIRAAVASTPTAGCHHMIHRFLPRHEYPAFRISESVLMVSAQRKGLTNSAVSCRNHYGNS